MCGRSWRAQAAPSSVVALNRIITWDLGPLVWRDGKQSLAPGTLSKRCCQQHSVISDKSAHACLGLVKEPRPDV